LMMIEICSSRLHFFYQPLLFRNDQTTDASEGGSGQTEPLNAGWDYMLLRAELAALQREDFNLDLIGFEDVELARLLAAQDAAEGLRDEDAVPELPKTPICLLGDLWILGDHRLLVGDAMDAKAVAKLMAVGPADLVFTDPPYNVD